MSPTPTSPRSSTIRAPTHRSSLTKRSTRLRLRRRRSINTAGLLHLLYTYGLLCTYKGELILFVAGDVDMYPGRGARRGSAFSIDTESSGGGTWGSVSEAGDGMSDSWNESDSAELEMDVSGESAEVDGDADMDADEATIEADAETCMDVEVWGVGGSMDGSMEVDSGVSVSEGDMDVDLF